MSEYFPIHLMIKPEGLEYFPDYLRSQLDILQVESGGITLRNIRTILTPDEVELIYPETSAPKELKEYLTQHPTEHRLLLGNQHSYEIAKQTKGKYDKDTGIRGTLRAVTETYQFPFEKWQNFVHTSDNIKEAQPVCSHFVKETDLCQSCAAKTVCYSQRSAS